MTLEDNNTFTVNKVSEDSVITLMFGDAIIVTAQI
jgi:hypothetical protein